MDRDLRDVGPTYASPTLRRYGKMTTVTQGSSGQHGDGGGSKRSTTGMPM